MYLSLALCKQPFLQDQRRSTDHKEQSNCKPTSAPVVLHCPCWMANIEHNSQMPELEHVSASPEGCTLGIHPTLSKLRPIISAHSPSSKGKTLEQLAPTLECFLQDQRRSPEHKEPSNPPQLLLSSIVYAGWQTLHSQMPRLEHVSVSLEGCTLGTLSSVSKLRLSISAHTPSSKGKTLEQLAPTLECFLQD